MNRFDRPDRNVRQSQEGFWKRPPQRWSGQEHYHLSHPDHYHHRGKSDLSRGSPYRESPLGHFESYGGTPFFQAQKMFVDMPENTVILDEMTLRHMVQDCTAVKTQLLKLKRLLHQHDGSGSLHDIQLSLPSSPEPEDGDQIYKGGYSAPSFSPWQGSFQGIPRTVPPHRRQTSSTTAFQQPSQTHRLCPGKTNKAATYRGPQ
ncbi:serine-rich coiled-coil domain-containing protein 2 isoform 5 [Daubentonia madagascariensis]